MKCPLTALKKDCTPDCKWYGEYYNEEDKEQNENIIIKCAIERLADSFDNVDVLAGMMMQSMIVPEDKEGLVQ